jgi:hypothetical protein
MSGSLVGEIPVESDEAGEHLVRGRGRCEDATAAIEQSSARVQKQLGEEQILV